MLAHSVVRGMSQGVLPLIAYNYATKNIKRMNKSLFISCGFSFIFAIICMILNLLFSENFSSIFIITERDSLKYASKFLKILTIGAPFSAVAYTIISFFQATKRSYQSLILALLRKGIIDIPLMLFLSQYSMILIIYSTPIADLICFLISLILFIRFNKIIKQKYINNKEINKK